MADLELLRRFVNTWDPDEHMDDLDTPEHAAQWFIQRGLLPYGTELTSAEHRRALEFREAIRDLAIANAGDGPELPAIEAFNTVAAPTRFNLRLGPDGSAQLDTEDGGLNRALAGLIGVIYQAVANGSWRRVKACSNDSCRWLYIDRSKNQSKKWCSMETCGNLINARAYRARRRATRPPDSDQTAPST